MWSKAYRVSGVRASRPPRWRPAGTSEARPTSPEPTGAVATAGESVDVEAPAVEPRTSESATPEIDLETAIREAYDRGMTEGRAYAEHLIVPVRERLAESLAAIAALRRQVLDSVERDVVELALAMARRILHREVALDPDLVLALAKVAVSRLGDKTVATIALNPADHAAVMTRGLSRQGGEGRSDDSVAVVADPDVPVGGSRIQSSHGTIDLSIDGQIAELAHALIGEPDAGAGSGAALH